MDKVGQQLEFPANWEGKFIQINGSKTPVIYLVLGFFVCLF